MLASSLNDLELAVPNALPVVSGRSNTQPLVHRLIAPKAIAMVSKELSDDTNQGLQAPPILATALAEACPVFLIFIGEATHKLQCIETDNAL